MTDIRNLKKCGELINCEGQVLVLRKQREQLYLESLLKNGSGYVYFPVSKDNLLMYLDKKITLHELYETNPEPLVIFKVSREEAKSYLKQEFTGKLQRGESYFEEDYSRELLRASDVKEIIASL